MHWGHRWLALARRQWHWVHYSATSSHNQRGARLLEKRQGSTLGDAPGAALGVEPGCRWASTGTQHWDLALRSSARVSTGRLAPLGDGTRDNTGRPTRSCTGQTLSSTRNGRDALWPPLALGPARQ
jgi:hypothetical protein